MITITTHTDIKRLRLRPKTKYAVFRLNVLGDGDLTCGIFGIRLCALRTYRDNATVLVSVDGANGRR
ncbi:hypothetical protein BDR06DRAFT_957357 [Suillus hirtellus]|nr:hypothetical protein BDR06DRAFT_957357 [Suillus hirtellus]